MHQKIELGTEKSFANYSFYLGATNDNIAELRKADPKQIPGVKVFMGSSTGNMLVDDKKVLQAIFAEVDMLMMLELACRGEITKEPIVAKMCHAPASLFDVHKRGYIRKGYFADLVLVNPNKPYTISHDNILYKCKWSPLEGETMSTTIGKTFLYGKIAFENGIVNDVGGEMLEFDR
ncbi:amidohydrolase family protein [Dysgonomonas sp. 511]|uniref:amidohydrolase family protein n=1 Tax=Dysgonomonas sp. 511 TaxID=2302930 RepID=UPI00210567F8|nr:amidohydrolase family protein [Dysgonomonas sp. 511]